MKRTQCLVFAVLFFLTSAAQPNTAEDSLMLFKNSLSLKCNLIKYGYFQCLNLGTLDLLREYHIVDAANHLNIPPKGMEEYLRYAVDAHKEGNIYILWDFYAGQINKKLGKQYFSLYIKPKNKTCWIDTLTGDARLFYDYSNAKPRNLLKSTKIELDTIPKIMKVEVYHRKYGEDFVLTNKYSVSHGSTIKKKTLTTFK